MGKSVKGTHAEGFRAVGEALGLAKETAQGILEEGVSLVLELYDSEDLYKATEALEFEADMHDAYLVDVVQVEERFGFKYSQRQKQDREKNMRLALREELKIGHPLTAAVYKKLADIEDRIRSKHISCGVEVDAAPPTLPLVQELKAQRALCREIEDKGLAHMMKQLAKAEREVNDSLSYYVDVFQPAWDDHNNPKGSTDDK